MMEVIDTVLASDVLFYGTPAVIWLGALVWAYRDEAARYRRLAEHERDMRMRMQSYIGAIGAEVYDLKAWRRR